MQLKPTTGPCLLMAGGGALLISFRLPVFVAAAVFIALGLWTLREVAGVRPPCRC
jgi:hypothetical protein